MFADKKFAGLILAVVFGIANASYGGGGFGGGIGGGGYGGGGFGGGIGGGYGDSYGPSKVEAAVNSNQKVRTYAVGTSNSGGRTTVVDINGGGGNLIMRFNGGGSNIEAVQNGIPGGVGRVQKQSLTAEPDMLIQNVQKPVIQKIRMHIQPLRQVIQEVRPAHEQIETVIAKGLDHGIGGGAGGYGGAGGAGGAGGGGKY